MGGVVTDIGSRSGAKDASCRTYSGHLKKRGGSHERAETTHKRTTKTHQNECCSGQVPSRYYLETPPPAKPEATALGQARLSDLPIAQLEG